jgi:tetratricopeptide (TPR) repeat protein
MILMRLRVLAVVLLCLAGVSSAKAAEPLTAEDWVRAGEKAQLLRDYDKAKGCFAAALLIDSDHYRANVGMAWIFNEKKDYDKASLFALKAIGVDTKKSAGWRELGYAEYRQGDLDGAEASLVIAITLDPTDKSAERYLKSVRAAKPGSGEDK